MNISFIELSDGLISSWDKVGSVKLDKGYLMLLLQPVLRDSAATVKNLLKILKMAAVVINI